MTQSTWVNADGLEVKFGLDEAIHGNLGSYSKLGPVHEEELLIKFDELPAVASNSVIVSRSFLLPKGAFIESVEFLKPSTTFVGGTVTFDVGIVDASDGTSNADPNALVDAMTLAEINAGGSNIAGWAGVAVGAVLARTSMVTWEQNTAAYTAGETSVRIKWYVPKVDTDTLVWTKP